MQPCSFIKIPPTRSRVCAPFFRTTNRRPFYGLLLKPLPKGLFSWSSFRGFSFARPLAMLADPADVAHGLTSPVEPGASAPSTAENDAVVLAQAALQSEARQIRKIAAALRKPSHPDAVDVNAGTNAELLVRLDGCRRLPKSVAQRIVSLRPFASKQDMVLRINAGVANKHDRLGPTLLPMLHVDGEYHPTLHTRSKCEH